MRPARPGRPGSDLRDRGLWRSGPDRPIVLQAEGARRHVRFLALRVPGSDGHDDRYELPLCRGPADRHRPHRGLQHVVHLRSAAHRPLRYGPGDAELVEPAQTQGLGCDKGFLLNLDPSGEHPDVLPVRKIVEVTGIFDHPAATACIWVNWDPFKGKADEPVPSQVCRLEFAVTRLVVVRP